MSGRTRLSQRFLESTRGRVVSLLRRGSRSAHELAQSLGVTTNAVRAHLASLERDGLIAQSGSRPAVRKPEAVYALTAEAEQLFPKAYAPILDELLALLATRLTPRAMQELLGEVAHRLAAEPARSAQGRPFEERVERASTLLAELGGLGEVVERDEKLFIQGFSCPLAAVVPRNTCVCKLAETLLSDIIGTRVRECCRKTPQPMCCFEVQRE